MNPNVNYGYWLILLQINVLQGCGNLLLERMCMGRNRRIIYSLYSLLVFICLFEIGSCFEVHAALELTMLSQFTGLELA